MTGSHYSGEDVCGPLIPTKQAVPILPQLALSSKGVNISCAVDRDPINSKTIKNAINPNAYVMNTTASTPGSFLAKKTLKRMAKEQIKMVRTTICHVFGTYESNATTAKPWIVPAPMLPAPDT